MRRGFRICSLNFQYIEPGLFLYNPFIVGPVEEILERGLSCSPEVLRVFIDVHQDEFLPHVLADAPTVLHRIFEGFFFVGESVLDALLMYPVYLFLELLSNSPLHDIKPERERGFFRPEFADVEEHMQPGVLIRELPLVYEEPGLDIPPRDGGHDLVESHFHGYEPVGEQAEEEVCRGELSRYAYLLPFEARHGLFRNDDRAVSFSHARAAGHDSVIVLYFQISVRGNCGSFEFFIERALVQGLNVLYDVLKIDFVRSHFPGSYAVKHESVVGVGAVSESHLYLRQSTSSRFFKLL